MRMMWAVGNITGPLRPLSRLVAAPHERPGASVAPDVVAGEADAQAIGTLETALEVDRRTTLRAPGKRAARGADRLEDVRLRVVALGHEDRDGHRRRVQRQNDIREDDVRRYRELERDVGIGQERESLAVVD